MHEAAALRLNSPQLVRLWREAHLRGAESSLAAYRASGDDAYRVQDTIIRLEAEVAARRAVLSDGVPGDE